MGELPHFRTAVGGFHKGDVSEYIAKTAQTHQAQLQEKEQEIERLRARIETLEQAAQNEEAAIAAMEQSQDSPEANTPQGEPISQLELEAYRRAEAAERIAAQRAKKLYEALGGICQSAQQQLDTADAAARNTITAIEVQIQNLENSCDTLTAALAAARQQLSDMDIMIPDPAEGLEEA